MKKLASLAAILIFVCLSNLCAQFGCQVTPDTYEAPSISNEMIQAQVVVQQQQQVQQDQQQLQQQQLQQQQLQQQQLQQQQLQLQQQLQQQQLQQQQFPQQQQQQPIPQVVQATTQTQSQPLLPVVAPVAAPKFNPLPPLYLGHNPFIERLKPLSYADDNIVTLNLSHSHIYEIDTDAFVGQRFEHIDLSNNKLGLIHSRSFRIGPIHSRHNSYNPLANDSTKSLGPNAGAATAFGPTRRPPPTHPKSVTIDFSHNPAIVALSGAFDHIDVPNCLLNFTNSTVELKFGAFKKYFKEHPGHIIDVESIDCCEQEWLLGYKHNFVARTHCDHDPSLFLTKAPAQMIIDSCIAYVTAARHAMNIQGPSIIHQVASTSHHPRSHNSPHIDNNYLTYVILGGTAMVLASLSIYILVYMCSLKAALVYRMQNNKA